MFVQVVYVTAKYLIATDMACSQMMTHWLIVLQSKFSLFAQTQSKQNEVSE